MRVPGPNSSEFRSGFAFVGGALWIDFVNSAPANMGDALASVEHFSEWLSVADVEHAHAITRDDLKSASALRLDLSALFETMSEQKPASSNTIAKLNSRLSDTLFQLVIEPKGNFLAVAQRQTRTATNPIDVMILDFARFLADYEPSRLRHCQNPECNLVFYDKARNATRRWCTMSLCGNRHKVAKHRYKSD